jgi:multiple sugar transport system substrate-binding protein
MRHHPWVVSFVLLLLFLTGCNPIQGASTSEPLHVTFLVFGAPADQAVYQSVVDAFEATQPTMDGRPIAVELTAIPSAGDFITRLTTDFAAGSPPDVFLLNYRRMAQFYNSGAIEPLGPWLEESATLQTDEFFPVAIEAFTDSQGTLICMPQNLSSQAVFYNKDLFDEAGQPYPTDDWTWKDFRQTALKLMKPDANGDTYPDQYGLGLEPVLIRMAPWIWGNGGELVDDPANPTRLTLDDPTTMEAMAFVISLARQDGVVPNYSAEAVASHYDRFLAGNIAMFVDSRVLVPTLRESVTFDWDVAPLPMGKQPANVLHSDAYCMASASTIKEAAWAFIEFAMGEQGQTIAAELGRTVPSLIRVAESPAFLEPSRKPANSQIWLDMAPYLRILPRTENWIAIERVAGTEFELAYLGQITLEEAVENIQTASLEGFVPLR